MFIAERNWRLTIPGYSSEGHKSDRDKVSARFAMMAFCLACVTLRIAHIFVSKLIDETYVGV